MIIQPLVFSGSASRSTDEEQEISSQGGFAIDRPRIVTLDGNRYMKYLKDICDLGPRMSGTAAMRKQQDLITRHFESLGYKVTRQTFQGKQPSRENAVEMTNLIISTNPTKKKRAIICCHYDTRPIADQEPDPRKWRDPFVSANDGGSGVAFMMELAHHLPQLKLDVGLDFVIFDGEEYIFEPNRDRYFLGSEHFAQTWERSKDRPEYHGAILLDMIAGKLARFPMEGYSHGLARELCQAIWGTAKELKCTAFKNEVGSRVLDDHLALLNVGIPAIDIIDFEYAHWHRLSDRPENCDPEVPIQVGKVLGVWLQRLR